MLVWLKQFWLIACSVHYRKNCSGNPHCLNGLGEKKWLNSDDQALSGVDQDSLKRGEVSYKSVNWCCLQWPKIAASVSIVVRQYGNKLKLEDGHSEECKLVPTLAFDLLTSNKMVDQDLLYTNHLPSLMVICPVVFVLECWHTHIHTHVCTEQVKALLPPVRWQIV